MPQAEVVARLMRKRFLGTACGHRESVFSRETVVKSVRQRFGMDPVGGTGRTATSKCEQTNEDRGMLVAQCVNLVQVSVVGFCKMVQIGVGM